MTASEKFTRNYKADLRKVSYLPDKKRILIDSDLPKPKQRWGEGHEIGHSIIPWHDGLMLGDSRQTLSVECHAQLEAEANYAAGQLLFLQDQFAERLLSTSLSLDAIKVIAGDFGNSLTTTLWRAVEQIETPCVGFVSQHPMRPGPDFDVANPCRYLIRSRAFLQRFAHVSERQLFGVTLRYCANRRAGPLGSTEVLVPDSANDNHIFIFETFYNGYDALTLGRYAAKKSASAFVA